MKRIRLWLGVLGLVASSYLVFDPADRLELAWEKLTSAGPYVLAALAVVNLGRAVVLSGSAYLGPGLLTIAAIVLLVQPTVDLAKAGDALILAVLIGAALLVMSAFPEERTWARVMWTGRVRGPARLIGPLRAVAVLGEVRVNLLACIVEGRATLVAVTLGGRVVVDLPREWRVVARPPSRSLLVVREHGRRDNSPTGDPDLEVRLLGLGGALELRRA